MKYVFTMVIMLSISQLNWAATIETDTHIVTYPSSPVSTADVVRLQVVNKDLCVFAGLDVLRYGEYPNTNGELTKEVNIFIPSKFIPSQMANNPCLGPRQKMFEVFIGRLEAGDYEVSIFNDHFSVTHGDFSPIGSFNITVTEENPEINPETPQAGSIQSGVGIIRGWACDARKVEVAFDGGERIPVAYGTSREDTRGTCGDANNGYGMVVNWGLLGNGAHLMRTFVDGQIVAEITFGVAGLDDAFTTGLSATYELVDFPAPGKSVTVKWSEADQNFIIIDQD